MISLERTTRRAALPAVLIIAAVAVLSACAASSGEDSDYSIIIYGSDSCSICVALRGELDGAEISYEYHDIRVDEAAYNELLGKIDDTTWFDGVVRTPVLEINGELFERPTLEQVQREIRG